MSQKETPPYRYEVDLVHRKNGVIDVEYAFRVFDNSFDAIEFKRTFEEDAGETENYIRVRRRLPDAAEMNPDFAGMIL